MERSISTARLLRIPRKKAFEFTEDPKAQWFLDHREEEAETATKSLINTPPSSSEPHEATNTKALLDFLADKSSNITVLNINTSWTKQMIVVSSSHVKRLSKEFLEEFHGRVEDGDEWILVDMGDVIVHFMTENARDMYDLEGIWSQASSGAALDGLSVSTGAGIAAEASSNSGEDEDEDDKEDGEYERYMEEENDSFEQDEDDSYEEYESYEEAHEIEDENEKAASEDAVTERHK